MIVNPTKSQFGISELPFLGHVITEKKIRFLLSKVDAIQKYPLPKETKQLPTYLGMVNFYNHFSNNLAGCLASLNEHLKKDANKTANKTKRIDEAKNSIFKKYKSFGMICFIGNPQETCKVSIVIDRSDIAPGAALQQETDGMP